MKLYRLISELKFLVLKANLIYCFCNNIYAQQNLIPNPSFEIYDTCISIVGNPTIPIAGKICNAIPWFSPSQNNNTNCDGSSTDFWHVCNEAIPFNFLFGYQYPRTGNGYAGAGLVYASESNFGREYLEVPLISKLEKKNIAPVFM